MPKFGRFETVRVLATSGPVTVYSAREGSSGEVRYAIKAFSLLDDFADAEDLRRRAEAFVQAAEFQKGLDAQGASHITQVIDIGRSDGSVFYAAPLAPLSAQRLIDTKRDLTAGQILSIVRGAMEGLMELAAAGRAHGQFKPGNVLFEADDPGSAVRLADVASKDVLHDRSRAEDLKALGALIFGLVTQRPAPLGAEVRPSREWTRLGAAGESLRQVCEQLLNLGPGTATPTLEQVLDRLRPVGGGGGKGKLVVLAAAVLVLAAGGVAAWKFLGHPPVPPPPVFDDAAGMKELTSTFPGVLQQLEAVDSTHAGALRVQFESIKHAAENLNKDEKDRQGKFKEFKASVDALEMAAKVWQVSAAIPAGAGASMDEFLKFVQESEGELAERKGEGECAKLLEALKKELADFKGQIAESRSALQKLEPLRAWAEKPTGPAPKDAGQDMENASKRPGALAQLAQIKTDLGTRIDAWDSRCAVKVTLAPELETVIAKIETRKTDAAKTGAGAPFEYKAIGEDVAAKLGTLIKDINKGTVKDAKSAEQRLEEIWKRGEEFSSVFALPKAEEIETWSKPLLTGAQVLGFLSAQVAPLPEGFMRGAVDNISGKPKSIGEMAPEADAIKHRLSESVEFIKAAVVANVKVDELAALALAPEEGVAGQTLSSAVAAAATATNIVSGRAAEIVKSLGSASPDAAKVTGVKEALETAANQRRGELERLSAVSSMGTNDLLKLVSESNEQTTPAGLFIAWRKLMSVAGYPNSAEQMDQAVQLSQRIDAAVGKLPGERATSLKQEFKPALERMWRRWAESAKDKDGITASLNRGKWAGWGVAGAELPADIAPHVRYNDWMIKLDHAAAALKADGKWAELTAPEKLERVAGALSSVPDPKVAVPRHADLNTLLTQIKSKQVMDLRTEGPGKLKGVWQGVNMSGAAEEVVKYQLVSKPGVTVVFRKVTPQGDPTSEKPKYLSVDEVSVGLLASISDTRDTAWFAIAMEDNLRFKQGQKAFPGPCPWTAENSHLGVSPAPEGSVTQGWLDDRDGVLAQGVKSKGAVSLYKPGIEVRPPSDRSPMNFISSVQASVCAAAAGCRLPTLEEWRAARAQDASKPNLRDKVWKDEYDYIRATFEDSVKGRAQPTVGSYLPKEDDGRPHDESDGVLWFEDASQGGDSQFHHVVGNLAEFVVDSPLGLPDGSEPLPTSKAAVTEIKKRLFPQGPAKRVNIVGASALSAYQDDPATPVPDKSTAAGGWSDVGFRLAFTAGGGVGGGEVLEKLSEALNAAGFASQADVK